MPTRKRSKRAGFRGSRTCGWGKHSKHRGHGSQGGAGMAGGKKHKILIEFYALRDDGGKYLGCMECTQDVEL